MLAWLRNRRARARKDALAAETRELAQRTGADPAMRRRVDSPMQRLGRQLASDSLRETRDMRRPEVTADVDHLLHAGEIEPALDILRASSLPADRYRLKLILRDLGRTEELEELENWSEHLEKLRDENRLDELRLAAETGDCEARTLLLRAFAKAEDVEGLRMFAGGDPHATELLLHLLAKLRRVDELRAFVIAGDQRAKKLLLPLLGHLGRFDDLRSFDDRDADGELIDQLLRRGLVDEAANELRERPNATPTTTDRWYELACLYAEQDRPREAIAVLRDKRIDAELLATLLAGQGEVTEALAVLDSSKLRQSPRSAARMRVAHGRLDELRIRADAGDHISAEELAAALARAATAQAADEADAAELDELRTRAATGEPVYERQLIGTLGRLGRLDELETLAADRPAARAMWWAMYLATVGPEIDDVPRAVDDQPTKRHWITEEKEVAEVIRLLVEKQRIDNAIALAKNRRAAGNQWAEQWIPDLPSSARPDNPDELLLTNQAVAAIQELLATCPVGEERRTMLRVADAAYHLYGELRLALVAPDRADISLACWHVNMDTASYFGDHPPEETEMALPPEGTAVPNLTRTIDFIEALAIRLKVRHIPRPNGSHLTITVLLPLD
ncbi:hypothetical protein GCM10009554_21060 [Kribbella koreensis]|uniref:Tetratricopeptide repeat protein n=2 Tax=Kribbella koreensis TaxID=57909 RepID=A0ABN1PY12_9ACTN